MKPKIVFIGGHHNSALVVANELKKQHYQIYWIGHKFTGVGFKSVSAEYQEVLNSQIPFYELKTGKFYRRTSLVEIFKLIFGFFQSIYYLVKIRPQLIVSFGGYLAVPVVISGYILGIKSITHEQTVVAGWANRVISPFVKKILLTDKSSQGNYPKNKTQIIGIPLRSELFDKKYKKKFTPPLIYVVGGKQGSHLINQALFAAIPELVKKYNVVHQVGSNSLSNDLDKARRLKESLSKYSDRYTFAPYFFTADSAKYLQSSEIVVSRSGAHLTHELIGLGKKTVFIPLSISSHNEQYLNAKMATTFINSIIILEQNLNSQVLIDAITKLSTIKQKKLSHALDFSQPTQEFISVIKSLI